MADSDNQTQIQIVTDTTGLKTGMEDAQAINKAASDAMRSQWQNVTGSVSSTVAGMGTQIKNTMTSVQSSIQSVFNSIGVLSATVAGGALFGNLVGKTTQWTGEVKNLQKTLGITAEDASVLNVALTHLGISAGDYTQMTKMVSRELISNQKAFGDLGVEVKNSDGSFRNEEDIMTQLITKLGDMKEGTDRNVVAAEIFKRTHVDINALMLLNADAMEQARQKAEQLHLIVGPEGEAMTLQYKESMNDLKLVEDSLGISIGSIVLPALTKLGSEFLGLPQTVKKAYDEHQTFVNSIMAGVYAWGLYNAALALHAARLPVMSGLESAYISALYAQDAALKILEFDFSALTAAEALAAGGWIIAAVAGIVVAFHGFGQTINDVVDVFVELKNAAMMAFNAIKAGFLILKGDTDGAKAAIQEAMSINLKDGIGQDWVKQISDAFSSAVIPAPEIPEPVGTNSENAPDFSKDKEKKPEGPDPYELAKAQYDAAASKAEADAEIQGVQYTSAQKLALYNQYLSDVEKKGTEQSEFEKGQYDLQIAAFHEAQDLKKAQLDLDVASGKANAQQAYEQNIALLKDEVNATLQGSKERLEAEKAVIDFEQQSADKMIALEKTKLDNQREVAEQGIAVDEDNIKQQYALGQISQTQEIELLNAQEAKKRALQEQELADEISFLDNLKAQYPELSAFITADQTKLNEQLAMLRAKNLAEATKDANDLEIIMKRPFIDLNKTIQQSMQTGLANVLKGTEGIKQAFANMGRQVYGQLINVFVNQMTQIWTKDLVAAKTATASKTATIQAGAAAQTAITATAAETSTAATATTTAANMSMLSAIGTALSSIPWYGWVGLAILAGVSSAQSAGNKSVNEGRSSNSYYGSGTVSSLPSYDVGTWSVPTDQIAQIHQGETIIPAKGGFADAFRNGTLFQQPQQNSSSFTHAPTYNVQAIDGRSFSRYLRDTSRETTQGMYRMGRNLTRQNPTRWGL